jgi:hypothetical protein
MGNKYLTIPISITPRYCKNGIPKNTKNTGADSNENFKNSSAKVSILKPNKVDKIQSPKEPML